MNTTLRYSALTFCLAAATVAHDPLVSSLAVVGGALGWLAGRGTRKGDDDD